MTCKLAIRAAISPNPGDPMHPQKGNIVSPGSANWDFGAKVVLPNWIVVTISDLNYKQVLQYHGQWLRTPQLTVVQSNPVLDQFRLRLQGKTPAASGRGGITLAEAQKFIDDWGVTLVSSDSNSVTFDLTIKDAGFSKGFWGRDLSSVVFAEISYDQGTGKHLVTADYSVTSFTPNAVAHAAIGRGADILDNVAGVLTYEIDRLDVRAELLRDIHEELGHIVGKTRYAITEAAVDTVIGMGGTGTFTKAQLLAVLIDRADG